MTGRELFEMYHQERQKLLLPWVDDSWSEQTSQERVMWESFAQRLFKVGE